MEIFRVVDKRERKEFFEVARIIYQDDPVWVCPLENHINTIFDPGQNVYYQHGVAERWVLKDKSGRLAGRIAAFIDHRSSARQEQPTGGIGFFECIKDREAAFLLFDTAKKWLGKKEMQAMDGPINFGETDKYWGLLVEGFMHYSYEIAYNPPYYQDLFESYGFKTYYRQEGFHLDVSKKLPDRFLRIAEWVAKKPGYEFRHFTWKEEERFTNDFAQVFNIAWDSFKEDFEPLSPTYIRNTLKKAKAVVEEEFIWFAYKDGRPVAIYLMFPDINEVLKFMNGKLDFLNKLRFLYLVRKKSITRARGILMGVIPEFQNLGIESVFIMKIAEVLERKKQYREIEFSWVGDFNPKMRKIFISVGCESVKHYITYRYLFDREVDFMRYPLPEERIEK